MATMTSLLLLGSFLLVVTSVQSWPPQRRQQQQQRRSELAYNKRAFIAATEDPAPTNQPDRILSLRERFSNSVEGPIACSMLPPYHCQLVFLLRKITLVPKHGHSPLRRGILDSLRIY